MRICIYTDVHWSRTSSILTMQGNKYSVRLEKLIESVNWAEQLAVDNNCDMIINLGDMFDKSTLSSEEIAALSEVKWAPLPHTFVLGNHEIKDKNKDFTSLHLIKLLGFNLITEPTEFSIDNKFICYLPYMFEYSTLDEIFPVSIGKQRIILSHNDIEGIQVGGYTFEKGFFLEDIHDHCDIFLNGHIHNKGTYGNMYNLGNLCGQNFGENGDPHNAYILDTETMDLQTFENPYALNFYKVNCINKIKLPKLKSNSVLHIRVSEDNLEEVKHKVEGLNNVIATRYSIISNVVDIDTNVDIIQIDHLQSLRDYIFKELGETEVVKDELNILTQ